VIGDNRVVREGNREAFYQDQAPKQERVALDAELAGIEFRKNIVDVQDYRSSQEFRHNRGEDQEIRN
jgi:hypothetical protein